MFILEMSREGQKALRDNYNFVKAQIQQYGVPFEETLQSGRDLSGVVGYADVREYGYVSRALMDKFFLTGVGEIRRPDRERTSGVVEVQLPKPSSYRNIFMGWDFEAVKEAVKGQSARERKQLKDEEKEARQRAKSLYTCRAN
ncbi:hypothetical protein BJX70DRAFT_402790 [Aspergillus crustosus]